MLSLATDESHEQTAAILAVQAKQAAWVAATPDDQQAIRLKHQTAQRMLRQLRVKIPFAQKLVLPSSKLVARRAFPQLLSFIRAVALLRQFRKKVHNDDYVVATPQDYTVAYNLMLPVLRRVFAPLSERALVLLAAIRNIAVMNQVFTRSDFQK